LVPEVRKNYSGVLKSINDTDETAQNGFKSNQIKFICDTKIRISMKEVKRK